MHVHTIIYKNTLRFILITQRFKGVHTFMRPCPLQLTSGAATVRHETVCLVNETVPVSLHRERWCQNISGSDSSY